MSRARSLAEIPAITAQSISDMPDRRIRRAADRARTGGHGFGLIAAVRARLTGRRTAACGSAFAR
jgi:hypothetical protein